MPNFVILILVAGETKEKVGNGVHHRGTEIIFKETATWKEFPHGKT
jgi:hypothetical protein